MNREDELFDDFLRSKMGSKEFANKPHYWQQAQEMIAQERKSNSSFRPVIFGAVVLLAVVGLGFLFNTRSALSPADSKILTASSVPTGTSTTSTYTVQATPVQGVAQTDLTTIPAHSTSNLQQQSPAITASPATGTGDRTPKHPKRTRNNKSAAAPHTQINYPQTTQVTDINGRTLITPLQITLDGPAFNKTSAYIRYTSNAQKNLIALEAGINMYNPSNSGAWNSINGQIGVRYYRYLNAGFALSTGLTYARLHQSLPSRTFESTDYDFGQNATSTTISTQRLDYIEIPVSALYHIAPKHALTAGVAAGYVIQSADKLTAANGKQTYEHGYLNAINRWDAQLNVGYQYSVSEKIRIRATYHMGLMDISDNTLFKQNETHTNKGLRVTLGYTIF